MAAGHETPNVFAMEVCSLPPASLPAEWTVGGKDRAEMESDAAARVEKHGGVVRIWQLVTVVHAQSQVDRRRKTTED